MQLVLSAVFFALVKQIGQSLPVFLQLVVCPRFNFLQAINNVEEEAHCYIVQCRRIVCGQYVADYSTAECRTFRPEGLRQLHTKLRMYSETGLYSYG